MSKTCQTSYQYQKAAINSYINRAFRMWSNKNLLKNELEIITTIAKIAGYSTNKIGKLIEIKIKDYNIIKSGQRKRKSS